MNTAAWIGSVCCQAVHARNAWVVYGMLELDVYWIIMVSPQQDRYRNTGSVEYLQNICKSDDTLHSECSQYTL